jgi:hypothetical protein
MGENVQRDGSRDCKKENPDFEKRKKKEEIISRNCLPHHKTASTFIDTHKQAQLHLLCMLSRYCAMSESVQRDDHRSSFHDMVHFRYDKQRPALHAEGLSLYCPPPPSLFITQHGYVCFYSVSVHI